MNVRFQIIRKKVCCFNYGSKSIAGRLFVPLMVLAVFLLSCSGVVSCQRADSGSNEGGSESLRQVLRVQSLYNNHPADDIIPEITEVIDSMRRSARDPYYFAAVNVLIDRLFSDGRFAEADSQAVTMEKEAQQEKDSVSMAMARRVRAQMFYKLGQPSRAIQELEQATLYITDPYRSSSNFGTATSIEEWKWIVYRELGDTLKMNDAGLRFAALVEENGRINNWCDSIGHYPASALAFKAAHAFSEENIGKAKELLDSASTLINPRFPARAYEHLYSVRCNVRLADRDWSGAVAHVDTLLATHKDFPWFLVNDLLLKARVLKAVGRYEESAEAYSDYVSYHDSLSKNISDKRLHDLTVLYRSELSREHKRSERFRMFAFVTVILLLGISLLMSFRYSAKIKKRNRLLVERLREIDRNCEPALIHTTENEEMEMSVIERLERYMLDEKPYHDPALSSKELASYCGMTVESLRSLIKTEKGTSVKNYINSFRVEEARLMLGSGSDEGISEMAARLGFGTARTLQRAFKERYDMSPTQYREVSMEIEGSDNQ